MKIWFSTGVTVSWENIGHLRSDLILTQGLVIKKKKKTREFPGGPVVRTLHVRCRIAGDTGLIPGQGTKIPHAMQHSQNNNSKRLSQKKRLWY